MARKNSVVSVETSATAISFNVEGMKPITLNLVDLNNEVSARALAHGLTQKVSDAAALPRNEDGTAATPADKHAAMLAVVERLSGPDGEWNKRGDASGETAPSGLIRRAFVEFAVANKKTEASANAHYDKLDRASQLALRKIPAIAEIMDRIKAERGATVTVDTDALLAELG